MASSLASFFGRRGKVKVPSCYLKGVNIQHDSSFITLSSFPALKNMQCLMTGCGTSGRIAFLTARRFNRLLNDIEGGNRVIKTLVLYI